MSSQPDDIFRRLSRAENDRSALLEVLSDIMALAEGPKSFEYTHCIHMIAASPRLSSAALSAWLTAGPTPSQAAQDLLQELSINNLAGEELCVFDAATMEADAAILVAHRLAASHAAPAVILGWIVTCMKLNPEPDGHRLVALLRHASSEYPSTTTRLLRNVDSSLSDRYPGIADLSADLSEKASVLDANPRLKELIPSLGDRDVLRRDKIRSDRETHRIAEEASVFSQIFTRSNFKYARDVALQYVRDGAIQEQAVPMQELSISVELPFLERVDPIGAAIRRLKLVSGDTP